jgi:methionyl-tRNA synthetase
MPYTSDKIRKLLNLEVLTGKGEFEQLLDQLAEGELPLSSGIKIGEPDHLFTRIDDDIINAQIEKLHKAASDIESNSSVEVKVEPIKDTIEFDDFVRMDIRVAKIIGAQKVPKADKLLQLELDLGSEKRTVVSGIAAHYKPEEIVGQKVSLLANLAPRKLRGVVSQGMILMAEDSNGKLTFVDPGKDSEPGSIIR